MTDLEKQDWKEFGIAMAWASVILLAALLLMGCEPEYHACEATVIAVYEEDTRFVDSWRTSVRFHDGSTAILGGQRGEPGDGILVVMRQACDVRLSEPN